MIYVVEYLSARIAFKTKAAAEEYVSAAFSDDSTVFIRPCILVGE